MERLSNDPTREGKQRRWSWWHLLLVVQFVLVLWPPFYNSTEPSWMGIPFFYWYQLLAVLIGAGLTAIVYVATERATTTCRASGTESQRTGGETSCKP